MSILIRKIYISPTRPCHFCLSLQDDSVFADFDVDHERQVYLVRISFDGYGCCRIDATRKMNASDSSTVLNLVETGRVNCQEAETILHRYFHENNDVIWNDALRFHQLL